MEVDNGFTICTVSLNVEKRSLWFMKTCVWKWIFSGDVLNSYESEIEFETFYF